nr:Down syndrome cell adhesion molecule-like protein Dscam2 [Parasteatoda tepidariorum]
MLPKSLLCVQQRAKRVMLLHPIFNILFLYGFAESFAEKHPVRGPSFVAEPPTKVEFSNSSGTIIPCTADGLPHPLVTWKKASGELIQDLTGLRYARHDGTLVFPPFLGEEYRADVHAAVYRCEVSNVAGIIGSREVHVRAVVPQSFETQLFDEFVLQGNMAVLHCPIPSYISDYVKVTSWERMDGFIIKLNTISGKYGMLYDGDLYIKDAGLQDSRHSFRCHMENSVTKEKHSSINFARIIVTEPRHNEAPKIMKSSTQITARSGERVTLACVAQGSPVPSYRWQKYSNIPLSLFSLDSSIRQENGILIFESIKYSHGGKYSCFVSNTMGEDKIDFELTIEEDLALNIIPKLLRVDIGNEATFNCSVAGGSADSIKWMKDMKSLSASSRISTSMPTVLHIMKVMKQDSGMYQCFAIRNNIESQASAQLVIGDITPKLKFTFPEKIVRPGVFVSLMCVATGNPEPQFKWSMDNQWPVSTRPGVFVSTYLNNQGEVFSYVNITAVDITDSGLYTCEAFNDAGSVIHSRRLNVFGNLFIRSLHNLSALSGEKFSILCPFGGYPFDSISWKKDQRKLPINQKQRVFPNGTVQISEMQTGVDDGIYSCEVTYSQGVPVSRSFIVVIKTKPHVSNFHFPENLHEGMRTAVACIVLSGDPPITIKWLKDGFPLIEEDFDSNIIHAGNGFVSTLTINTLSYKHNGNYTCMATNKVGTGSYSTRMVVRVPPRWILQPKDTSAIAGQPAKIDCQADGVPQPHVRWKVSTNGMADLFKTIVSSSYIHILVNGSLNFRSVEKSDEGAYLCEANNGVGTGLSTVVNLKVHSAPKFHTKFFVLTERRGEKVVLTCISYGDIPMTFIWRKNGEILDPQSKPRYSQQPENVKGGAGVTLVIEKVERGDTATFTCSSMNDFGEDSMNFQLTIQDVPDAPQNLEIHDVGSRTVRLTWNRPFNGNSPILHYSISWRDIKDQSLGGPLTVPGDETTLTVRGLSPKTRYFFRVKCENSLGESQYGAEVAVTTLEEPPRNAPLGVKAIPISSTSINISWQRPIEIDRTRNVDGFYVGYKTKDGIEPYTFKSTVISEGVVQYYELRNLNRYTEYSVIVQPFNSRGAGPPSDEVLTRTLEFDAPGIPSIKSYFTTSKTIKLSWEINVTPYAPVLGYILYNKMEGSTWQEIRLKGDYKEHLFQDLQCGTKYFCYIVAFNSAGRGNSSEIISVKTDGNAPIAPDKRFLLNINYTTLLVNLNSWHNGGCPIRFFIVQYKVNGQQDWTLVSNNIIPEQQNITIMDLIPGTWYSLLMTARNDAGSTDAEYVFATMTMTGEYPPRPSEMSEKSGPFFRHLLITVPVVSSAMVLIVVLCVVYFITRRNSTGGREQSPDGIDRNEPIKAESLPLSTTYETALEPTYFPTPYAASKVTVYNRDTCLHPGTGHQQNTGTFGSSRSGCTYDIPYPTRKVQSTEKIYESPILYFPVLDKGKF